MLQLLEPTYVDWNGMGPKIMLGYKWLLVQTTLAYYNNV